MWLYFFSFVVCLQVCRAGYSEDVALYDLIDEVGQNFYDVFSVAQDASIGEIKKSYRRLSLEWHPDRNSADNAADKFRQIAGVYDVLKRKEMREKYDDVLVNGMPDWRHAVYYYRRARKLSWYETLVLLSCIFTGTHFLMLWGSYYEKYLNESSKRVKPKKGEKKKTTAAGDEEESARIEEAIRAHRPSVWDALPFVVARLAASLVVSAVKGKEEEPVDEAALAAEAERAAAKEEKEERKRAANREARKTVEAVMAERVRPVVEQEKKVEKEQAIEETKASGSAWSTDELANLVRLTTEKYPPGAPNRWEQIAAALQRNVNDALAMAGKLKQMKQEEYNKLLLGQSCAAVQQSSESTRIDTTAEAKGVSWTQQEQKALEQALQEFGKDEKERWEKISAKVGKPRQQCVDRFKHIVAEVKARKATK